MPGKGTPIRTLRVPDDVWQKARERAEREGTTVSDVLQAVLREYADGRFTPPSSPG